MGDLLLSPTAEVDLDNIWLHIAEGAESIEVASRFLDGIAERVWLLAEFPYMGRRRDDLRAGLRSFVIGDYVVFYRVAEDESVFVLHVVHGSRDISALFEP